MARTLFCKCGNLATDSHSYCLTCKAEYMRHWRSTHPLSAKQRFRRNSRAYARVYISRGLIDGPSECAFCGEHATQMHHEDYSKPLEVTWLCKQCHQSLHALKRAETELANA